MSRAVAFLLTLYVFGAGYPTAQAQKSDHSAALSDLAAGFVEANARYARGECTEFRGGPLAEATLHISAKLTTEGRPAVAEIRVDAKGASQPDTAAFIRCVSRSLVTGEPFPAGRHAQVQVSVDAPQGAKPLTDWLPTYESATVKRPSALELARYQKECSAGDVAACAQRDKIINWGPCERGDLKACSLLAAAFATALPMGRFESAVQKNLARSCDRGARWSCRTLANSFRASAKFTGSRKDRVAVFPVVMRGCRLGVWSHCASLAEMYLELELTVKAEEKSEIRALARAALTRSCHYQRPAARETCLQAAMLHVETGAVPAVLTERLATLCAADDAGRLCIAVAAIHCGESKTTTACRQAITRARRGARTECSKRPRTCMDLADRLYPFTQVAGQVVLDDVIGLLSIGCSSNAVFDACAKLKTRQAERARLGNNP